MRNELKIAAAEAEVERSRAQLIDTIHEAADMFAPKKIINEVWESAKNKGADLAEDAVDAVTSRPMLVGGAIAAIAAFLAREPIKDAAVKAYGVMTSPSAKKTKKNKGEAKVEPVTTKPVAKPAPRRARSTTRAKTNMETPQ